MPVLATYFSVRRGRDPFFKFYMRTIFARQLRDYEKKYGIKFLGWYNVAHGWDFDNVILLDLPDYATLDRLEADEGIRELGHRAGEWIFQRHHSMFLRERMGPTFSTTSDRMSFFRGRSSADDQPNEDRDRQGMGGNGMDTGRNDLLGEIAADAALERSDFLVQSTEQLRKFIEANRGRINELGGLTLIDEDPDYLAVAADGTFRSRTRYLDDVTNEWTSETEVIETASELIELYNPADIYQAFAEAAREGAGLPAEPTAEGELLESAGIGIDEAISIGGDPYAAAADDWAAAQPERPDVDDDELAAQRLYDLALEYQERSQRSEARLLEQFGEASENLIAKIGDLIINDDDDERLTLTAAGEFRAEVLTEEENEWRPLKTAEELVEYYDPTDVFGDLADALAEAFPAIAPELAAFEANGTAAGADGTAEEPADGDDDAEAGEDDADADAAEDDARR